MALRLDFTSPDRDPQANVAKLRDGAPVVKVKFPIVGTVWVATT